MVVRDDNGNITHDIDEVLQKWKNDFHDLYNAKTMNGDNTNDNGINMAVPTDIMNESFTPDEILKVITKAKKGKAMGPDNIPYEVLKNNTSVELLTVFFNTCYSTGYVPTLWTKAYIKPIPKGNTMDKLIPTNYRGISLLSCVGKLYSSVINTRLLGYLETRNMLVDEQNGFRPKRACVDHLHSLTSIIRNRKLRNMDTFVCFIDMSKAFDHLNRTLLFNKLVSSINIGTNMYLAIRSLYHNTMCRIVLNNHFTDYFDVLSGVKQGDTLSTTLFAVYIDSLARDINTLDKGIDIDGRNVGILLYADDIALIASNEQDLQCMLDETFRWCKHWKMSINRTKTKVIHFRKKSKDKTKVLFKCGPNTEVEITEMYKYLGCTLHETFDYTKTAQVLSNVSSRALDFQ